MRPLPYPRALTDPHGGGRLEEGGADYLVLQNDGHLVARSRDGELLWITGPKVRLVGDFRRKTDGNDGFGPSQSVWSANRRFRFTWEDDGNMVLYRTRDDKVLFQTDTHNPGVRIDIKRGVKATWSVVSGSNVLWSAVIIRPPRPVQHIDCYLSVEDNGDLVLLSTLRGVAWRSNTAVGPRNLLRSGDQLNAGEVLRSPNQQYELRYGFSQGQLELRHVPTGNRLKHWEFLDVDPGYLRMGEQNAAAIVVDENYSSACTRLSCLVTRDRPFGGFMSLKDNGALVMCDGHGEEMGAVDFENLPPPG